MCCQCDIQPHPGCPPAPARPYSFWFFIVVTTSSMGTFLTVRMNWTPERYPLLIKRVLTGPVAVLSLVNTITHVSVIIMIKRQIFFPVISPAATEQLRSRPEWRCHIIHAGCRTSSRRCERCCRGLLRKWHNTSTIVCV